MCCPDFGMSHQYFLIKFMISQPGYANSLQEVTDVGAETTHDIKVGYAYVTAQQANTDLGDDFYNFGFGLPKFENLTTGFSNQFFGEGCLTKVSSGCFNFAFGSGALGNVSKGWQNVAMGNLALYFNTTGSGNIALGKDAGVNVKKGSQNIYIGTGTGWRSKEATDSESFRLRIHQHGVDFQGGGGSGVYNEGKMYDLIYGEFDKRVVRIGGELSLRPEYNPDTTDLDKHHKIAVADDDNAFSFVDKLALIKAVLLDPDFSLTEAEKDTIAANLGLERKV